MNENKTDALVALEKLDRYIRARYPVIAVVSHEENRVLAGIKHTAVKRGRKVATWSITEGFKGDGYEGYENEVSDPNEALSQLVTLDEGREPTLFIFKDLHPYVTDPIVVRFIRDIANKFSVSRHTLVLLCPEFKTPTDLEKTVAVLDYPLPDSKELEHILIGIEQDLPESIPVELDGVRGKVVRSLRGLTAFEAESVLLSAIAATGELSEQVIGYIVAEKKQIIRKSGVLEFFDTTVTMNEIGGLSNVKRYAEVKMKTFSAQAKEAGVDPAKGCLLVGIPGTGKSLTAKAIAGGKMPLLRMDIGALMGGLVGQSEQNTRLALKVAEAVAPCALWIDEIEKSLGSGGGELDGGTTQRVFGTILTWIQETTAPVYIIATANDISMLKPELLRRFDDILFVDLPNVTDREEILRVHLEKRNKPTKGFDLKAVAQELYGFTGAEIEKVVKSALEHSFFENKPLTIEYINQAAKAIVPISETMSEQITNLRAWAKGRTIAAGNPLEARPKVEVNRAADL